MNVYSQKTIQEHFNSILELYKRISWEANQVICESLINALRDSCQEVLSILEQLKSNMDLEKPNQNYSDMAFIATSTLALINHIEVFNNPEPDHYDFDGLPVYFQHEECCSGHKSELHSFLNGFYHKIAAENPFLLNHFGVYEYVEFIKNEDLSSHSDLSSNQNVADWVPIKLTSKTNKNELPTYFYNLLHDKKINSSAENLKRLLIAIIRDKDGNLLSTSSLNDIFNSSKPQSRSKKVT